MAATSNTSETYECVQCDDHFAAERSVAGSFCSGECYRAHQREKRADSVLELIAHDHRFCVTCCRQLKEIERPTDEQLRSIDGMHSAESLVGLEYQTQHADHGLKTDPALFWEDEDGTEHTPDAHTASQAAREGVVCTCGATDTGDVSDAIRASLDAGQLALRLVAVIEALHAEGKHDVDYRGDVVVGGLADGLDVREALAEAVVLDG